MKILVTGANGFLGRHVALGLQKDHGVRCLVRRPANIPGAEEVLISSWKDPELKKAVEGIDVIVHIAAQLHGPMDEMMESNVHFTRQLVDHALHLHVKQFILISTENVTQGNVDIYSRTKMLAEKEAQRFPLHLILRPTIIYGPSDTKYVGRLIGMIRKFPLVPVLGNGKNKFQFVYADDLVKIIRSGINEKITGTFTIAGPETFTYNEFMARLMKVMNTKKTLVHIPVWMLRPVAHLCNLFFKRPPLTPTQLDNLLKDRSYDIQSETRLFNYKPVALEEGLAKTLDAAS